jgi:hypothetical protein
VNIDPLVTTLLDLTRAIDLHDFKLILGGGFGLYLKQLHHQRETAIRTLIPGEFWPYPRATEDLDVFLPTEIVIDLARMQALRAALDAIGFLPVEEAKFLHFAKPWGAGGRVKIDMLTGPILDPAALDKVKITRPRVRPRGQLELHAYLTDEAIDFDRSLLSLSIEGVGSDAQPGTVTVHVPQPFTFILMKLHAFADRAQDLNRDLGRHHALDVYRLVAMLTPTEYDEVRRNVERNGASSAVRRSREIVADAFSSPTAIGIIRLREHELFRETMSVGPLIGALADLFRG